MVNRGALKGYIWIHVGIVAAVAFFPLYQALMEVLPKTPMMGGCFLHDYLKLYCALCGGTRSVGALLQLDVVSALRYNPLIPILASGFLVLDVMTLVRILRGKARAFRYYLWFGMAAIVLLFAYTFLRNYLMIAHGYDPVGDLGVFWKR